MTFYHPHRQGEKNILNNFRIFYTCPPAFTIHLLSYQ